jgi:hypothetical protein
MANEKRGLQGIRTMGALIDTRRTRTPAGALLELSAMANERLLLEKELKRQARRTGEINTRLGELAAKQQRLLALVQYPDAASSADSSESQAVSAPPADVLQRMRVKEFSY